MSEEKDFDEILRSKFEEQSFPFDEGNWDEAEEIIERQRRKEKRRRRFILFFIGIMTGIGIALPFFYNLNNSIAENKVTSKNSNENKKDTITINEIKNRISDGNKIKIDSTKNENFESENSHYNSNESEKLKTSTTNNEKKKENRSTKEKTLSKKESKLASNSVKTESDLTINKNSNDSKWKENLKNDSDKLKDKTKTQTMSNISLGNNENKIDSTELNNKLTIINVESIVATEIDTLEISKTDSSSIYTDSTVAASDSIPTLPPFCGTNFTFSKTQGLSLYLGGVYNIGWNYNDTLDGNGFSPAIGINYQSHFKENLLFNTSLIYQFTGNLNYSYKNSISHQPGFGLNDSILKYSVKRNHYIVLPIMMYLVKNKNRFGLGTSFTCLFGSISDIHTIRQTNSSSEIISENKGRNYMEGFNRLDISLNLSYRRKLNSKFDFITDFNFGLLDQKNNTYFNNSSSLFERNIYIRSGLTFNIFGL